MSNIKAYAEWLDNQPVPIKRSRRPPADSQYLTLAEVADLFRVHTRTIRRKVAIGEIPKPRLKSPTRWRKLDLDGLW